jgi:hypothetical protein
VKSPVTKIMGLAAFKQLLARGIELPIEECEAIVEAVIEEAAGVAEGVEQAMERAPA